MAVLRWPDDYPQIATLTADDRVMVHDAETGALGWAAISSLPAAAPDVIPPNVPINLTATPGFEKVTLNWDNNGEADLLRYEYRVDGGTPVDAETTSAATVTGLTNDVEYDFQVRAVDFSENASAWSAIVSATPEWDPSGISAATRFYDAGALDAVDGSSPATWPDLSDNNTDLVVSGTPVYHDNPAGGYPMMRFIVGTLDGYEFPSAMGNLPQPWTIGVVYRFDYKGANPGSAAVSTGGGYVGVGSGQYALHNGGGTLVGGSHNTSWQMVVATVDGASSVLRRNGAQVATGNPGSFTLKYFAVGGLINTTGDYLEAFEGDIAAVVLVPGEAVTGADLTALEAWLNARKPTTYPAYGSPLTTDVDMLLVTGQSNAEGGQYTITTAAEHPTNVYKASAGGYIPLTGVTLGLERPEFALTASVYEADPDNTDVWASATAARNGESFGGLVQGTDLYNANMAAVTGAVANTSGTVIVRAVHLIHGEYHTAFPSDTILGWYAAMMGGLHVDYDTDIKAETGQTEDVMLVFCQDNSWKWYADNGYAASRVPGLDQLAYHVANADAYMVGPKYGLPYDLHLSAEGYHYLGELHAKVIDAVVHNAGTWEPTRPTGLVRTGAQIDVTFVCPVGPLAFDTTVVAAQTNYGFSYTDDSGAPPAISSVTLLDADTVRITLASTPTGANKKVGYAITGNGKGNLRDSDPAVSTHDAYPLYNWCVMFQEAVA